MKRIGILCLSFFLGISYVSAHSAKIKGYSDVNSQYISSCGGKYYGYHKHNKENHWHEVKLKNGTWEIINSKKELKTDPCNEGKKYKVSLKRCVDGDTAVFIVNNKEEKFRFLAVDTPESVHPKKDVQVYAKEASKSTCDLLTNASSIYVEYDNNSDKKDKYGRNLAWIWVDDILLQELMISEGYARVAYIYGNYKYVDDLCSLQNLAIKSNKGIWQYGYEVGYCDSINTIIADNSINNIYNVSFKDENGTTDVKVAQGMKVKEIEESGKIGYYFLGWYHNNKKFDFNEEITSNIVLEARYKFDYAYLLILLGVLIIGMFVNVKETKKHGKNN